MTKQKDRIEELEGYKGAFKTILPLCIFILVLLILVIIVSSIRTDKLEQQLESCQEKVLVWTLMVYCDYGKYLQENTTYSYGYFEDYQSWRDFWDESENCEVIK